MIGACGACASPEMVVLTSGRQWLFATLSVHSRLALFTPTILVTFGYTAIKAVLYTIPIHLCSVTWGILNAILADKFQHRSTLLLILNNDFDDGNFNGRLGT